jgi:hypothetical protein
METITNNTSKEKKDIIKAPKTGARIVKIFGNANNRPTWPSILSISAFCVKK